MTLRMGSHEANIVATASWNSAHRNEIDMFWRRSPDQNTEIRSCARIFAIQADVRNRASRTWVSTSVVDKTRTVIRWVSCSGLQSWDHCCSVSVCRLLLHGIVESHACACLDHDPFDVKTLLFLLRIPYLSFFWLSNDCMHFVLCLCEAQFLSIINSRNCSWGVVLDQSLNHEFLDVEQGSEGVVIGHVSYI